MISTGREAHDQRGASVSVLVAACLPAFALSCGLAVDGSARLSAQREVTLAASQAARAGSDSYAHSRLAGRPDAALAIAAARASLSGFPAMTSDATVDAEGRLSVSVSTSVGTQFLSLVGIDHFTVRSRMTSDLRAS
ncbi:hypothetical protein SAMN05443377_102139 [Propionibacterium cyclohexanicum]|uniref:Flp pilus-assembly TadE/G-like n=1 Tax=Propionibacterium cyclohexanicum TaxID=64702 RepID=A0A1H9Q692_9ACTN|nr:hypothetical protein [Propionibacterium cyclohexanicum]SER55635.1 hypothetical protein SAMN05443377_102139 [Propionibacterium cyclohexanicum]